MARESLNAGIGVLLGVTGVVLGSFARFFIVLARRASEAADGVESPVARPRDGEVRPGARQEAVS